VQKIRTIAAVGGYSVDIPAASRRHGMKALNAVIPYIYSHFHFSIFAFLAPQNPAC
jgi:hypothetical protein